MRAATGSGSSSRAAVANPEANEASSDPVRVWVEVRRKSRRGIAITRPWPRASRERCTANDRNRRNPPVACGRKSGVKEQQQSGSVVHQQERCREEYALPVHGENGEGLRTSTTDTERLSIKRLVVLAEQACRTVWQRPAEVCEWSQRARRPTSTGLLPRVTPTMARSETPQPASPLLSGLGGRCARYDCGQGTPGDRIRTHVDLNERADAPFSSGHDQ